MSYKTFSTRQKGAALYVTLNNPPVNLMNIQMVQELFQLTGQLNFDPSIKVVVFDSANPEFFVAHFDLDDLVKAEADPGLAGKFPDINVLQSLGAAYQVLPQVTIAKIKGRLRGGGLEFVLSFTMRFASNDSKLCFPEASAGFLAAGGGATRTLLAAGPARGLEILLSSRDFSGEEAERYGLVNRALPATQLDDYVEDLVMRIAKRSGTVIAMNREVVRRAFSPFVEPMFDGFAAENDGLRSGFATEDMRHGVTALLNVGQTRKNELDLPATIAALPPSSAAR